jgi:pimeloyl-ACP methyl ester carboxylesterase
VACNILPPWPSRDPRAPLDVWRLFYQLALGAPKVGGALGRRFAERILRSTKALTDGEIAAFVDRLGGERELATRLLYRNFALREIPKLAGRYRARDLTVPTLILFGDRDEVIPLRTVRAAASQSDRVELEPVPGASHFIVDERPQLVAERALDFFGLRAVGSAPGRPR